jgi:hypothetical protein
MRAIGTAENGGKCEQGAVGALCKRLRLSWDPAGRIRELAARTPAPTPERIDEIAVDEPAEAIPRMLGAAAPEAACLTALPLPQD